MGMSTRGTTVWVEGAKILALVGVVWLVMGQTAEIRHELGADRVALAASRSEATQSEVLAPLVRAVETTSAEVEATRARLEKTLSRLEGQKKELASLLTQSTKGLETTILELLDAERRTSNVAASVAALQAEKVDRLEKLGALVERKPAQMKQQMLLPTVQLRGRGTVGSGVIVYSEPNPVGPAGSQVNAGATTLVLTAYHVVLEVIGTDDEDRRLDEVHVFGVNGTEDGVSDSVVSARLVAHDSARDIALLKLESDRRFPHVAELISVEDLGAVDIFTPTYAVGCPLGNNPLPTIGEVSSKRKIVGEQDFWMINAPTFFGNSGGGVYLARNYKLIGISSMIYTYGKTYPTVVPHMGLFVPLNVVYEWLDSEGYGFVYRREPVPESKRAQLRF